MMRCDTRMGITLSLPGKYVSPLTILRKSSQLLLQFPIEYLMIDRHMRTPVAIGTKCNDPTRITGTTIGLSAHMVQFKIRGSIHRLKWCE